MLLRVTGERESQVLAARLTCGSEVPQSFQRCDKRPGYKKCSREWCAHSNPSSSPSLCVAVMEMMSGYSYRRFSTGSSCDARVAGTVPKMMPTIDDTMIAMMADRPEMGKW